MFVNLDNKLYQQKKMIYLIWTLNNYSAQILCAKYEKVNINKVAADQKINALTFIISWPSMKNYLMALLVSIHIRKFTLIYFLAWYCYTIECIRFLAHMKKPSKKNYNTWWILVFLKNVVHQSGPCGASLYL